MQKVFRVVYMILICQAFISFSLLAQKKDFVLVEAESLKKKVDGYWTSSLWIRWDLLSCWLTA